MSLLVLNANIGTVFKPQLFYHENTRKCTKCAKVCQFSSLAPRPSMRPLSVLAVAFTKPDWFLGFALDLCHFLSLFNSDAEAGVAPVAR